MQAIGGSGCSVIPLAMIKHAYPGIKGTKILALWGMILPMTPGIAGLMGGNVTEYFSWRGIFFLLVAGSFVLWMGISAFVIETRSVENQKVFTIRSQIKAFGEVLRNRRFLVVALLPALGFAGLSIYNATSPFIFIAQLGLTPFVFGFYLFITLSGTFFGSLVVRLMAHKWALGSFVRIGICLILLGAAIFVALCFYSPKFPILYALGMMVYALGFGMMLSAALALGIDISGHRQGHAAGLMRAFQFLGIAGGVSLAGLIYQGSFVLPGIVILGIACLMGLGVWRSPL